MHEYGASLPEIENVWTGEQFNLFVLNYVERSRRMAEQYDYDRAVSLDELKQRSAQDGTKHWKTPLLQSGIEVEKVVVHVPKV